MPVRGLQVAEPECEFPGAISVSFSWCPHIKAWPKLSNTQCSTSTPKCSSISFTLVLFRILFSRALCSSYIVSSCPHNSPEEGTGLTEPHFIKGKLQLSEVYLPKVTQQGED